MNMQRKLKVNCEWDQAAIGELEKWQLSFKELNEFYQACKTQEKDKKQKPTINSMKHWLEECRPNTKFSSTETES